MDAQDNQESRRLGSQLRRAFEGEAWHGPSVSEVLTGVTREMALARPIAEAHSIWELVQHITAWERVSRRRIGGETVRLSPEKDWPPISNDGEDGWRESLATLEEEHRRLREAISGLTDSQLREKAAGEEYSIYFLIQGVIQHDIYHAGQIAILKKALSSR